MEVKAKKLKQELLAKKDIKKSKILSRYFKTGLGEYGEGDIFLGISVLDQRKIIKNYLELNLKDLQSFLDSDIHEFRFSAVVILIKKYQILDQNKKKKIVNFYLKNLKNINNWDLVDLSCPNLLGSYLLSKDRDILYKLSRSRNLWFRRIAIVSTHYFIKNNDLEDAYKISKILLNDKQDLINKAVGWTLRELGKKDKNRLEKFLQENKKCMPRVTLRYAIEKFNQVERKKFLKK